MIAKIVLVCLQARDAVYNRIETHDWKMMTDLTRRKMLLAGLAAPVAVMAKGCQGAGAHLVKVRTGGYWLIFRQVWVGKYRPTMSRKLPRDKLWYPVEMNGKTVWFREGSRAIKGIRRVDSLQQWLKDEHMTLEPPK